MIRMDEVSKVVLNFDSLSILTTNFSYPAIVLLLQCFRFTMKLIVLCYLLMLMSFYSSRMITVYIHVRSILPLNASSVQKSPLGINGNACHMIDMEIINTYVYAYEFE